LNLDKVTIVTRSVKKRRYKLCSGVETYYDKSILVCMQCVVQNEARFKYELPDDGHRPKHVGAF